MRTCGLWDLSSTTTRDLKFFVSNARAQCNYIAHLCNFEKKTDFGSSFGIPEGIFFFWFFLWIL